MCGGKNDYYFTHCGAERKKEKKNYMPKYAITNKTWLASWLGREFMMNV